MARASFGELSRGIQYIFPSIELAGAGCEVWTPALCQNLRVDRVKSPRRLFAVSTEIIVGLRGDFIARAGFARGKWAFLCWRWGKDGETPRNVCRNAELIAVKAENLSVESAKLSRKCDKLTDMQTDSRCAKVLARYLLLYRATAKGKQPEGQRTRV